MVFGRPFQRGPLLNPFLVLLRSDLIERVYIPKIPLILPPKVVSISGGGVRVWKSRAFTRVPRSEEVWVQGLGFRV